MKLTVIGLGIHESEHLTLESVRAVRAASFVLYLPIDAAGVRSLLSRLEVTRSEDLRPLYVDGAVDLDNYRAIFRRVLAACRSERDVALLIPGHPRVGVTILQWLEAVAETIGLELRVLEGLSSFCSMINDLRLDPLENGSALVDCNRLLDRNLAIEPALDYFFYHVCSIRVAETHLSDSSIANRIDLLRDKLLRHYEPDHAVMLVSSSLSSGRAPERVAGTVGELPALLPRIHFGTTLHIPAARSATESRRA